MSRSSGVLNDLPGGSGTDASPAAPPRRRTGPRQFIGPALSLVLIGVIFFYFLPQFTSISAVWAAARSMTWLEAATLVAAAGWNLATYCSVMVATMPGLTYRQAAVVTQTGTAVANTVPGGGAIGIALSYAMFSSWGFSRSRTSVSQVLAGLWNNFVKLGMPVLALALLALSGTPSGGRVLAGLAGVSALVAAVVALGLLLHSERSARGVGIWAGRQASRLLRVVHRPPVHGWEMATANFATALHCYYTPGGTGSPWRRSSVTSRCSWCCCSRCAM